MRINYKQAKLLRQATFLIHSGIYNFRSAYKFDMNGSILSSLKKLAILTAADKLSNELANRVDDWFESNFKIGAAISVDTPFTLRLKEIVEAIRVSPLQIRYSALLYGEPGVGKTFCVQSLKGCTIRRVNSETLAGLHRSSEASWESSDLDVFLVDEVDKLIQDNPKNESVLLQLLDSLAVRKCIVIMTTNYKDRLPPALLRNGRVSEQIEVLPWTKEYAARFCKLHDVPLKDAPIRDNGLYYAGDLIEWAMMRYINKVISSSKQSKETP